MYTIQAAYVSFEETVKGTISPGKLADLVVLSDDPTQVAPEEIKGIKVMLTIIDGKIEWEKKLGGKKERLLCKKNIRT